MSNVFILIRTFLYRYLMSLGICLRNKGIHFEYQLVILCKVATQAQTQEVSYLYQVSNNNFQALIFCSFQDWVVFHSFKYSCFATHCPFA
jgi:hypothetical protein